MRMVAMEAKIKPCENITLRHIKYISYHVKILKFCFGREDSHITDFITKCLSYVLY
jgi:hypothetical protein